MSPLETHFPRAFMSVSREEMVNAKLTIKDQEGQPTTLPEDLQGHVFIMCFAGTAAAPSPPKPPQDAIPHATVMPGLDGRTALFNGDGMVYRLDFNSRCNQHTCDRTPTAGQAWLTWQLLKPPAFFADKITQDNPDLYNHFLFQNFGIARLSQQLGPCHQINTAFVPVKFSEHLPPRLLATTDANRPYEIDPYTLKIVAPIGELYPSSIWHLLNAPSELFEMLLGAAHPCTTFSSSQDGEMGELFTVNSIRTQWDLALHHSHPDNRNNEDKLYLIRWCVMPHQNDALDKEIKGKLDCWEVLYYDPQTRCHQSIQILQSSHMLGITENYIILADTAMKLDGIELIFPFLLRIMSSLLKMLRLPSHLHQQTLADAAQALRFLKHRLHLLDVKAENVVQRLTARLMQHQPLISDVSEQPIQLILSDLQQALASTEANPSDHNLFKNYTQYVERGHDSSTEIVDELVKQLRLAIVAKQNTDTPFYIIKRSDLVPQQQQVYAKRVIIPRACEHYLTDYQETPSGEIVITALLTDALDPDEYIDPYDRSLILKEQSLEDLAGMFSSSMDSNVMSLIKFRPEADETSDSFYHMYELTFAEIEKSPQFLNGQIYQKYRRDPLNLGLYAYRDTNPKITDFYVVQGGGWPELLTEFIYDLYRDYSSNRRMAVETLVQAIEEIIPIFITHVRIDRGTSDAPLQVLQTYQFDVGVSVASLQFIPRAGSQPDQGDVGYILCTVVKSDCLYSHHLGSETGWSDNSELWIFDAQQLSAGPLYKLSHPHLNLGLTLHSTWLEAIAPAPAQVYSFKQDYQARIEAFIQKNHAHATTLMTLIDKVDQEFSAYRQGQETTE